MAKGATRKQGRVPAAPQAASAAALLGRCALFACTLASLLGLSALVYSKLSNMPIEQVEVSGEMSRVSRERLQEMVIRSLEGGFVAADLALIREPLESLPWIYRVVIKRRWPNTLEIVVTEQLPIARWGESGFLNHEGEVFLPENTGDIDELPRLSGPQGSQRELMAYYRQIQQGIKPAKLQLASLEMDVLGSLHARLTDGLEVVFGRGAVADKLERFLAVYKLELQSQKQRLQRVDLRYEHGLAVAWRDDETRLASVGE